MASVASRPTLIERRFPLKQPSIDSVNEKSVRHGHISTLDLRSARRLMGCAALSAVILSGTGGSNEHRRFTDSPEGLRTFRQRIRRLG